MRSDTALRPSVAAAFESFVDYAGLFPPAQLSPTDAVAEYADARQGSHAWMLGRFIVPASRVHELGDRARDFSLSVIIDAKAIGSDTGAWFAGVQQTLASAAQRREMGSRIEAVEILLPALRQRRDTHDAAIGQVGALLRRHGLRDLPVYLELPRGPRWLEELRDAFGAIARSGLGAKLRCGGLSADAFPSTQEVAAFVAAATAEGVPFKATAGLHHPVRHYAQEQGAYMHGFLNLLAASVFAPGADEQTVIDIVAEENAGAFVFDIDSFSWRDMRVGIEELQRARKRAFVGYGSCSFAEPVQDLIALGVFSA